MSVAWYGRSDELVAGGADGCLVHLGDAAGVGGGGAVRRCRLNT